MMDTDMQGMAFAHIHGAPYLFLLKEGDELTAHNLHTENLKQASVDRAVSTISVEVVDGHPYLRGSGWRGDVIIDFAPLSDTGGQ